MVIKSLKAPRARNKKRPFMKASVKALRAFGEDRSGTFAVAFAGAFMALGVVLTTVPPCYTS